jgi:hypothetical protein
MDESTLAGRINAKGGGGLPESVIQIADRVERKRRALAEDRNISDTYRREQLEALDVQAEADAYSAMNAAIDKAKGALEQRKSQLLSQIKSQFAPKSGGPLESLSEQAERHHRETLDTVGLLPDVFAAQSAEDPIDLLDTLEEALLADRRARILNPGPVIVARLVQLTADKHDGAAAVLQSARRQFNEYRKSHPSRNQQLRETEAELREVARPISRNYQKAIDYFKIGAASRNGIRL